MSLHHRLEGGGARTLVLSGSLGTTLELWDGNVGALSSQYRLLRYDHRGHGGSPVPPGPYTVEDLAEDVLELLDELGLERVSFCGLSLGGAVGMALAIRAPERLERLILCCTSARFGEPETWVERARTVRAAGLEAIVDTVFERWFTPAFRATRPEVVERFREQFVATPREGYAGCCDALARWDARANLGSIAVPTLAIAAADDPATPPEQLALDRRGHPGCGARGAGGRGASRQRRATRGVCERDPRPCANGGGTMSDPLHDRGMETRREVLGDEHVDAALARTTELTAEFQDLITRYAWGEIWSRPGLDRRTRSCITLMALIALNREPELAMHLRAALRNGLTQDEIKEVLLQSAIYCGVPAANGAFAIAQQVFDEDG